MIRIASPDLSGNELGYVESCITSSWISSIGSFVDEFEAGVAKMAGTDFAVATNNGTTALHLALAALGVGPGDEVVVPALTYIATANAVTYCGATPVFADVDAETMNVSPTEVDRLVTERTKAIVPVHLYGHPANMGALTDIADRHGVAIVEDAAEAHGARVAGRPVGSLGTAGMFSFFGNKIVTTGEGGAVTTDDPDLDARLRLLRGQGMDPSRRYWFNEVGFNYRMTNVAAALGVAQLERLDDFVAYRREIADRYTDQLRRDQRLVLPAEQEGYARVDWLYTIRVEGVTTAERNDLIDRLAEDGIETRPVFYPLTILPPYRQDTPFPVAERLGAEGLSLPTHTLLSFDDVDTVCEAVLRRVGELG